MFAVGADSAPVRWAGLGWCSATTAETMGAFVVDDLLGPTGNDPVLFGNSLVELAQVNGLEVSFFVGVVKIDSPYRGPVEHTQEVMISVARTRLGPGDEA